jgi:hypothetical protein
MPAWPARIAWGVGVLVVSGSAYLFLGPRVVARDPEAIWTKSGWEGVAGEEERGRIRRILESFFAGFNTMVLEGEDEAVRGRCEGLGSMFRPFCYEGAAAGYLPRGYFRPGHGIGVAEERLDRFDPDHRLLHYVGLGVWAGLRHGADIERAGHIVAKVQDRRHRSLVWNGYGFARAALAQPGADPTSGADPASDPFACGRLREGPAAACAHGYGRGLWFRHMGDEARAVQACGPAGEGLREDCIVGVGLASAFVHPDGLARPLDAGDRLSPPDREEFRRGVRAALLVRHQSDADLLEGGIDRLEEPRRSEVRGLLGRSLDCYRGTIERDTFYDDFMACR